MSVSRISTEEDSLIESVVWSDTLTDFYRLPTWRDQLEVGQMSEEEDSLR